MGQSTKMSPLVSMFFRYTVYSTCTYVHRWCYINYYMHAGWTISVTRLHIWVLMYMVVCVHVYIQYVCMYIYSMCSIFLSSLIMQLCVTHPVPMGSVLLMTLAIVLDSVGPLAAYQVSCYTDTHAHTCTIRCEIATVSARPYYKQHWVFYQHN